ncbi:hypothetical protein MAR_002242 [Mya arenaria]|uniref:Uncharacterized protein n=1 Tax=Mya arenaria TaxID=6604 RepID=A0ABY7FHQ4_MYAAR|nr:hypothetical protein MAR_002242 [Mya arenaria]
MATLLGRYPVLMFVLETELHGTCTDLGNVSTITTSHLIPTTSIRMDDKSTQRPCFLVSG